MTAPVLGLVRRQAPLLLGPDLTRRARRLRRPAPRSLLRRRGPVSQNWGFDRGTPVDRWFLEAFLARHAEDISGRVLEVKDDACTRRHGRGVTSVDVLDVDPANPRATVVADLADARGVPSGAYDCFVLLQTLHLVYDLHAAVREAHRLLRPGGVLLATLPCLSRTSRELAHLDSWRITPAGARRLFGDVFGADAVQVAAPGNAVLGAAFLMGVSAEELPADLLALEDPLFPLVVTVRAVA